MKQSSKKMVYLGLKGVGCWVSEQPLRLEWSSELEDIPLRLYYFGTNIFLHQEKSLLGELDRFYLFFFLLGKGSMGSHRDGQSHPRSVGTKRLTPAGSGSPALSPSIYACSRPFQLQ